MKLKEGMYVRTEQFGNIGKYMRNAYENPLEYIEMEDSNYTTYTIPRHTIKNASYNIIDLIEVGDYVNGRLYHDDLVYTYNYGWIGFTELEEKDIRSIVTKEQFESMQYKVN